MKKYDYILVGSGLYAGVFAWYAGQKGKTCLVVERRNHLGGNIYCEDVKGIHVHKYGAHIFHTSNRKVWDFVNSLAEFNRYTNSPVANYKGEMYNMPFNMNTFSRLWGISTPSEAKAVIDRQREEIQGEPENLEEQAVSLVGRELYEKLIKGYTEKQWGRDCRELPAFIIKRIPVRYTYDNNYFNDLYQGIPIGGYNVIIGKLFEGCDVELGVDYLEHKADYDRMGGRVVYTGTIDAYFGYRFGKLEYRSLRFESDLYEEENHQGVAVVNYTDRETPYTRTIEHKHFEFGNQPHTVVTREYPVMWEEGMEPYYPVNDEKNQALYRQYAALAEGEANVIFGGRLGEYKYYDMDKVIESAMKKAEEVLGL
ncbi:MAG: UDP-galactopyranose mutase [Clostridium sp.]|nr:UDP-galactopyranose mutase [Clostridium sp.]